jgi:MBG domain (YGX type)
VLIRHTPARSKSSDWWAAAGTAPTELTVDPSRFPCILGVSLALTGDGNTALAFTILWPLDQRGRTTAEFFHFDGRVWSAPKALPLGAAAWPLSLSRDGRTMLASESGRTLNAGYNVGGAEEFRLTAGHWSAASGFSLDSGADNDSFGVSSALSGDGGVALVGVPGRTVHGKQWDGAGEVYVTDPTAVAVRVNSSSAYSSAIRLTNLGPDDAAVGYNPSNAGSGVTGSLTCSTNATPTSGAAGFSPGFSWPPEPYNIWSCHGLEDAGHRIVYDYVNSSYRITPFEPRLSWSSPSPITYGTRLSATQLDAAAADALGKPVPGTFEYRPKPGSFPHAGRQGLSAVFTPDDTVDFVRDGTISTSIDVNPANLLIAADDGSVAQGFPLPVLSWSANFVARDAPDSLTTQPLCTTSATTNTRGRVTSPPGIYPITCSGAADPDYTITYSPGTLTVQAPLEISGRGDQSKQTVTFSWAVVSGPRPLGFNLLGVSQKGAVIRMNSHLIQPHAGPDYSFVAHSVKVDIDSFYVRVKTSAGFMKFGPFVVTG